VTPPLLLLLNCVFKTLESFSSSEKESPSSTPHSPFAFCKKIVILPSLYPLELFRVAGLTPAESSSMLDSSSAARWLPFPEPTATCLACEFSLLLAEKFETPPHPPPCPPHCPSNPLLSPLFHSHTFLFLLLFSVPYLSPAVLLTLCTRLCPLFFQPLDHLCPLLFCLLDHLCTSVPSSFTHVSPLSSSLSFLFLLAPSCLSDFFFRTDFALVSLSTTTKTFHIIRCCENRHRERERHKWLTILSKCVVPSSVSMFSALESDKRGPLRLIVGRRA